ncbi:B12-binding domain-containing radical SAM protein [Clostridium aminobutyricum]|uniref:Cobalamin-dependent protein n=1 Tax=Clostridium aminobutyricum TaxID=33953 RepID=A0A939D5W1_CLOAM|nr:radical SAM protein [Clostridium aminobutyricum]MBN7771984.1 cobalamin-dependent protein [Clostridium aminobutyricum]
MRKIREILFSKQELDIALIQPNFLMPILESDQNEIVREYWKSMNNSEPLGDTPNEPNHGLFSLAASLRQAGHSVDVLDFQAFDRFLRETENRLITLEDIKASIAMKQARYFGISTITVASENALHIARIIKEIHPDSKVIFGGMHPTLYGEHFIKHEEVDIIIPGEGNQVIVDIVETSGSESELAKIDGILFKDHTGNVVVTKKRSCCHIELDELPYPAYDLICQESLPLMPRIFSVRGCPFSCVFCSCNAFYSIAYDDYVVGVRDPKKVVDEIEHLYNNYSIKFYCFGDLTFMTNKKQSHEICNELIKRGLGHISWWCQTTVGRLNLDDLQLMKKAGCVQVGLGVENSSQDALDLVGKPFDFRSTEQQCKLIRQAGIDPITYWMVGLGTENFQTSKNMIDRICYFIRNDLTELSHIGVPVPYPGSLLWNTPEKYGLEIVSKDFSNYWMNSDELGYSLPAVRTKYLSREHIYAIWQYALIATAEEYKNRSLRRLNKGESNNEQ